MNDYIIINFIFVLLSLIPLFIIAGLIFYYDFKLVSYLKSNDYKQWREITSIGRSSPGYANPFKGLPYIFSDDAADNDTIYKYKCRLRRVLKLMLFFIVLTVLLFCSLILLIKKFQ